MITNRLYFANLLNALLPTNRFKKIKIKLYRWSGCIIGNDCEIFQGAKILGDGDVIIGNNVFIGLDALIMTNKGSKVIVEDYALVGHKSIIVTGFHPITPDGPRIIGYEGTCSTVKICKGASLGLRAILLPGKTLNTMCHAAAGCIVTHDVPPFARVAGIPAKVIADLHQK